MLPGPSVFNTEDALYSGEGSTALNSGNGGVIVGVTMICAVLVLTIIIFVIVISCVVVIVKKKSGKKIS